MPERRYPERGFPSLRFPPGRLDSGVGIWTMRVSDDRRLAALEIDELWCDGAGDA